MSESQSEKGERQIAVGCGAELATAVVGVGIVRGDLDGLGVVGDRPVEIVNGRIEIAVVSLVENSWASGSLLSVSEATESLARSACLRDRWIVS